MAKSHLKLVATIFFIVLFVTSPVLLPVQCRQFSRKLSTREMGLKEEKLSHLRFYFHEIVSGKNPTTIRVAEADSTEASATGFGTVIVMDDPLTEGPNISSKLVGRAQGIFASAAQNEVGLFVAVNYAFVEGEYNGSTLTVMGRNPVYSQVREMPIVGGSGLFRFARGYDQPRTYTLDLKTGDAVVEHNVYVFHY